MRLRVEHTGFERINARKFGQKFVKKVANPEEILLFHKKRQASKNKKSGPVDFSSLIDDRDPDDENKIQITELVQHIMKASKTGLGVLPESQLAQALQTFVDKGENLAFQTFVEERIKSVQKQVLSQHALHDDINDDTHSVVSLPNQDQVNKMVQELTAQTRQNLEANAQQQQQPQDDERQQQPVNGVHDIFYDDDNLSRDSKPNRNRDLMDSDDDDVQSVQSVRSVLSVRSTRSRASKQPKIEIKQDVDEFDFDVQSVASRPARRSSRAKPKAKAVTSRSRAKKSAGGGLSSIIASRSSRRKTQSQLSFSQQSRQQQSQPSQVGSKRNAILIDDDEDDIDIPPAKKRPRRSQADRKPALPMSAHSAMSPEASISFSLDDFGDDDEEDEILPPRKRIAKRSTGWHK